ncbi:Hypothetical predicted protein [Pelobates cultripes]|nr:Hypothetical predicted protein [Pelobates cultripes]
MESKHKRRNIRLCGIPEHIEGDAALPFLRRFMASLGIGGNTGSETLTSAFRVRKAAAAPADAPRDKIAVTKDIAIRSVIMAKSRELGTIHFEGCDIAIYGDPPFAVLTVKRQLTPVARQLREALIKYRWGVDGSLLVAQGNDILTLSSPENKETFLQRLKLNTTIPVKVQKPGTGTQEPTRVHPLNPQAQLLVKPRHL